MHMVKFSVNGQQANVARSTADVVQSAGQGSESGDGRGQRVELRADVALT